MRDVPLQGIDNINAIDEKIAKAQIEKTLALQKALQSGDVEQIYKANNYYNTLIKQQNSQNSAAIGNKSLLFDPFENAASMGYYNKQTSLSFEGLRAMGKAPIIRAIIDTRKEQISEYTKPQPDKYSKGFIIRPINKGSGNDDTDKDISDKDKRIIEQLTTFVLNCGDEENKFDLDDFEPFIRKIVDDSLVLDQATFEIIQTRAGAPTQFIATDAATFRVADSYDNVNNIKDSVKVKGYYPSYVQIYQGRVVSEFYPWELCFGTRNPSTGMTTNGYGRSELENLVSTVTSMLNADAYNGKFFRNGSAPKGALLVKGTVNPDRLAEFRKEWNGTMSGVDNMHKTPILEADKFEWLDLQKTNRDMEFSKFYEFLIKIACAMYKISPEEVGFPLEGQGGGGMNSDSGKEEKKYSQDKGLKPLLRSIQSWLNKYVIGPLTKFKYELVFMGLDSETSQDEEERLNTAATVYMTVNEVRAVRGLDPIPGGDVILNPVYMQSAQAEGNANSNAYMDSQTQTNPFDNGGQDPEEDKNPMMKSLNEFWDKEMIVKS